MNVSFGNAEHPIRVCAIGSGPSSFYAVEALFKAEGLTVQVDMFDRLPTPFGLVRGGVAPDHQNIKTVVKVYQKVAEHPSFRFFGNVKIGRDLSIHDLERHYHAIIWGIGCESDHKLGIAGENLGGVHSATDFVGWYNGHPDYRHCSFDLASATRVALVGNGNVSMDVARVLLKDPAMLASTDIAEHALATLQKSNVREVIMLGRRGPAQAAFSPKEIEEIDELPGVDVVVSTDDGRIDDYSARWVETQARSTQRNVKFLTEQVHKGEGEQAKKLRCRFLVGPVELLGNDGKVTGVKLQHAELVADKDGTPRPRSIDRFEVIDADLVFKAIGYRGVPLPGLAFDDKRGIVANAGGRVLQSTGGATRTGHYAVGWAKRGPTGLVGTNSPDSKATVEVLIADIREGKTLTPNAADIKDQLRAHEVDFVSWQDWQRLDAFEQEQGKLCGKVRLKQPSIESMMTTVRQLRG
ncbi:MAG: NADP oxidoreductase [Planctomycetota bacterium]